MSGSFGISEANPSKCLLFDFVVKSECAPGLSLRNIALEPHKPRASGARTSREKVLTERAAVYLVSVRRNHLSHTPYRRLCTHSMCARSLKSNALCDASERCVAV